ncbi:hypothetical protein N9A38_04075 [Gammaproteobacteria bacterium]|nr:hypothetical protein [Gammaproteobacteria bacterium]
MSIWKYFFSLFILLVGLLPFYVNNYVNRDSVYGGKIFYTDVTAAVISDYISFLSYALPILSTLYIVNYFAVKYVENFSKIKNYFCIEVNNKNILINFIIVFFISFLFKSILFNFNFELGDAKYLLNDYYHGDKFDVYKLYTLLAIIASKISDNYSLLMSIFNIITGSLAISTFYLLLTTLNRSFFFNNLVTLIVLFYLPISAVDTLIRVDGLYLFLFILSIFLTVKLTETENLKYFVSLSIVLLLSCIAREQTIYMLPLYLIFILSSKINNKKIIVSFISLIVIITSTLLSNYNKDKYGISSLFKDRILIIAAMQYGYLQADIKKSYENRLSDNAKILLNDINDSYIKNILPSKREAFKDIYELPRAWSLIRPDNHNIYSKNYIGRMPSNKELVSIKSIILKDLENLRYSDLSMSSADFDVFMNKKLQEEREVFEERVLLDIQSIIVNDFYYNSTSLGDLKLNLPECNKSNNQEYSSSCLIKVISYINYSYLYERHDNWYYTKAALEIASKYDPKIKKYIQHKYLEYTSEIMLSHPMLYISQSILTGFSMTGYVPVPSGMTSRFIDIYSDTIFPDSFLYDFQRLYYPVINFWYIHCFLLIIFALFFLESNKEKNISLFLSFIPFYYGAFLAFANYAEFARLMMPIIPLIIYNYLRLYKLAPIPMTAMFILPLILLN